MPNRSKQRGGRSPKASSRRDENELVDILNALGEGEAVRAWGSNGRALGRHEEVDVFWKHTDRSRPNDIQVKGTKALPKWLGMTEHVDAVFIRVKGNRHKAPEWFVLQRLEDAL